MIDEGVNMNCPRCGNKLIEFQEDFIRYLCPLPVCDWIEQDGFEKNPINPLKLSIWKIINYIHRVVLKIN